MSFLKSPPVLITVPVIVAACLLELTHAAFLQRVEWITYDWRVRLAHHASGSTRNASNLGVVEISDSSIDLVGSGDLGYQFGLYWPRQVYARALNELTREGAKAVAFDVLFAGLRADQPPVTNTDGSVVSSDQFFADQLDKSGNAILAAESGVLPNDLFRYSASAIGNIGSDKDPDGVLRRDQAYKVFKIWHPLVLELARIENLDLDKTEIVPGKIRFIKQSGEALEFPADADGRINATNFNQPEALFRPFSQRRVWSMGIILGARQLDLDLDNPDIDPATGAIALHGPNGLTRVIPANRDGYYYIDWSMALSDTSLSAGSFGDLLIGALARQNGHPPANTWSNKLVIIGSTATGNDLTDLGATPLDSSAYLMSKHWNIANSIITGRFIRVTPLWLNLALIVAAGALSAWITWSASQPFAGSVLMLAVAAVYFGLTIELYNRWRIWLPLVLPLGVAALVTHIVAVTWRVRAEQSEKKKVKEVFQRLVSPAVVNELLGAKSISLETVVRRDLTIYFADIRGFTQLSDEVQQQAAQYVFEQKLSPAEAEAYFDEQAREVLNTVSIYLGTIVNVIFKYNGTLDKYIGDCVMAFWNAPTENPRHALDAVRAAIDSQRALASLNRVRRETNREREEENVVRKAAGLAPLPSLALLDMGSGINTGMAIAGLMGSEKHLVNYTVFGREVNLASRLEGVSGRGRIIIGEGTHLALRVWDPALAATCREMAPEKVKGFAALVRSYEVPWDVDPAAGVTVLIEKKPIH